VRDACGETGWCTVALSGEVDDGEEVNAAEVTERGLVGDRGFAVVDPSTGLVAGAKNSRKWGNFFDFHAAYTEPPQRGCKLPVVRVTLPDGAVVTSDQPDLTRVLAGALGDEVRLRITGGCPRCVMTTLPQADLPRAPASSGPPRNTITRMWASMAR
jgi:hypothetical protein